MLNDWRRDGLSANTINRRLACYKKFGGFLGWSDFLTSYKPPKASPGVPHPLAEGLSGVMAMIDAAKKPHHKAYIVLCGIVGCRSQEACTVRPSHLNEKAMTLHVYGKGDKQRDVHVNEYAYKNLLPRLIQTWDTDELLVPLSDRAARNVWENIGRRTLGHATSSHDGRMTVGTVMYYHSGGDIRAVQTHLGHASSSTTELYTQVSFDKLRKAADFVPLED